MRGFMPIGERWFSFNMISQKLLDKRGEGTMVRGSGPFGCFLQSTRKSEVHLNRLFRVVRRHHLYSIMLSTSLEYSKSYLRAQSERIFKFCYKVQTIIW